MALEPQVEKSINRHRQRRRLDKVLVVSPIITIVIAFIVLMAVSASFPKGPEWFPGLQGASVNMMLLAICFLPYFFIVRVAFNRLVRPAIREFDSLTGETGQYDHRSFERYKSAIQAVGIGSGILAPPLVVLDIPTANSIAFKKGGVPAVGVTPALLEAGLTSSEIEAVMAHEVSHIVAGDELGSPNIFAGVGGAFLVLIVVALPFFYSFASIARSVTLFALSLFLLQVMVIASILLSMHLVMRPYSISRRNPAYCQNEIFADSVAAKLTSDPEALESAIEKLVGLMRESADMPKESIGFTQLFIGPLKRWPLNMPESTGQVSRDECRAFRENEMDSFISWENRLLEARLHNLKMIEMNKWEAFEVRGGRPIVPPDKWFR